MKKRFICLLCVCIVLQMLAIPQSAGAAVPKITASPTAKNVKNLLKKYNSDAYYIVKKNEVDLAAWCKSFSGYSITKGLDTIVHETYHGYVYKQGGIKDLMLTEAIYRGNKKNILLTNFDGMFKTSKAVADLPGSLRTFRFKDYVSASSSLDSNKRGIYGLMNEFTAYYWGFNTMSSLKGYYGESDEGWENYVSSLGNNMTAYAEFKLWILKYMMYAKKKNRVIYNKILNDKNYCKAYNVMEKKFAKLIKQETKYVTRNNSDIELTDTSVMYKTGQGVSLGDYYKITNELKKQKYINMEKKIKNAEKKK